MVSAPWQEGLLILSYNEGMICNLSADYRKRKHIVKHLEIQASGSGILIMSLATDGSPHPVLLPASKITKYSRLHDMTEHVKQTVRRMCDQKYVYRVQKYSLPICYMCYLDRFEMQLVM